MMLKKIFQNLPIKLISLGAAIILWIFVVGIENSVFKFTETLDISLLNLDKNVSVSSSLPPVNIFLKDDQQLISTLTKSDFTVSVDLSGLKAGEYDLPVSATAKNPSVRIVKIDPNEIRIKLAPVAEKEVKISAAVSGAPASGFAAKEFKLEFDKVKILGAQNYLDQIDEVEADLVLAGTEKDDLSQNISLSLPAKNAGLAENVKIAPAEVLINLKIIPLLQQKKVPVELNLSGAENLEIWKKMVEVSPREIMLEGDDKAILAVTSVKTAELDVATLVGQAGALKVDLVLPAGVGIVNGGTSVSVTLKKESVERKTVAAPVVLSGKALNIKVAKVSPPSLTVTVTGAATLINNLKENSITYTVDLSKISSLGPVTAETAGFNLSPGLSVMDFKPKLITLE